MSAMEPAKDSISAALRGVSEKLLPAALKVV